MAILAGIDEAGYGPALGPLVVSGVAFRVPDDRLETCLWKTLRNTCTANPARARRRLAIADSKKLYHGELTALERAALVMLAVAGKRPASLLALLDILAPGTKEQLLSYPWYAGFDAPLPLGPDVGDVGTKANAVRCNCIEQSIDLLGVFCEPLLEGHYNRLVASTRNKAAVNMGLALRIAERIRRLGLNEPVRICVDRLGGRLHYRDAISTSWPEYSLQVLEEGPERSAYRLAHPRHQVDFEFLVNGEARHMPVALASIYSKYVRELFMHAFNGYWSRQDEHLLPTAGYSTDARRWLNDAGPLLHRLGIDRRQLVRER